MERFREDVWNIQWSNCEGRVYIQWFFLSFFIFWKINRKLAGEIAFRATRARVVDRVKLFLHPMWKRQSIFVRSRSMERDYTMCVCVCVCENIETMRVQCMYVTRTIDDTLIIIRHRWEIIHRGESVENICTMSIHLRHYTFLLHKYTTFSSKYF